MNGRGGMVWLVRWASLMLDLLELVSLLNIVLTSAGITSPLYIQNVDYIELLGPQVGKNRIELFFFFFSIFLQSGCDWSVEIFTCFSILNFWRSGCDLSVEIFTCFNIMAISMRLLSIVKIISVYELDLAKNCPGADHNWCLPNPTALVCFCNPQSNHVKSC